MTALTVADLLVGDRFEVVNSDAGGEVLAIHLGVDGRWEVGYFDGETFRTSWLDGAVKVTVTT